MADARIRFYFFDTWIIWYKKHILQFPCSVSVKCVAAGSWPARSSPGGEIKQRNAGMRFVVFQETSPKHSNPFKTFVSSAHRKYGLQFRYDLSTCKRTCGAVEHKTKEKDRLRSGAYVRNHRENCLADRCYIFKMIAMVFSCGWLIQLSKTILRTAVATYLMTGVLKQGYALQ